MTTTTLDPGIATGTIETYRKLFKDGHGMLMTTFAATPDDKLDWKPAETARSAKQIAAHVAAANNYFILAYQGNPPATEFPEIMKWIHKKSQDWTDRGVITKELERSHGELDQVFAKFTPEMLENEQATIGIWVSAFHGFQHGSQIDYLQTCWGDLEFRM
jgi:hypothetical protein